MKTALVIAGFIVVLGVGGEYEITFKSIGALLIALGMEV